MNQMKKCPVCKNEFKPRTRKEKLQKYCSNDCRRQEQTKFGKAADGSRVRGICSCGNAIKSYKSKICIDCELKKRKNTFQTNQENLTLSDCIRLDKRFKANHKYQTVRNYAKKTMVWNKIEKKCKECGYDKYVEVCHKKAISEFPLDTKLSIINSIDNLIYLCPNHHWELDNLSGYGV